MSTSQSYAPAQKHATSDQVEKLLDQMTLREKIGQMTQVEKNSLTPKDVRELSIGSVLSGGGGNPTPNNPQNWAQMVRSFASAALETRLAIPLIYGADCVHGHNNCAGAVIFPHNIGLGAARDPLLVEQIGRITAQEMLATNVHWNFAPCLAVPQDLRWGRTYEGYSSNTGLNAQLGAAYTLGLQSEGVAACAKHFVGDGGAEWDTRRKLSWLDFWERSGGKWKIDQGDVNVDEETFRAVHLAPYHAAIEAGALTVMASFNSWHGLKMHAHRYLLTDVLKGEMGFKGFVVSDWMGINQLSPDLYTCIMQCINAGIDMVMVPYDFKTFIEVLEQAVTNGDVALSRIDDAVRRILWVKHQLGLFEHPLTDSALINCVGATEHFTLAREAVRKSAVLLKNNRGTLPLDTSAQAILLAGEAAHDMGLQCGGWTIEWQGKRGNDIPGTTLLTGLSQVAELQYAPNGVYAQTALSETVGIVVIAEQPYAEGSGDAEDLSISAEDIQLIQRMRAQCERLVLVIYSGRPLIITDVEPLCDAIVAAWLPGSAGEGLVDLLIGTHPFSGKLPHDWIASMDQTPRSDLIQSGESPLYRYGHGLTTIPR